MKNIAIVWGGYSSEMIVSAKSMQGIYGFMDKEKYNTYKVQVSRDAWTVEIDNKIFDVNKNDFSFTDENGQITKFDFAYITIHGTPGEDGRLQGYFDMINIPYSTSGMMASALTINKYLCNKFLKNFDIKVADSYYIRKGESFDSERIVADLGLPIFVKPNTGGSSFATTKVKTIEDLPKAIEVALSETDEVIIESFMKGREVTCGCYKTDGKEVLLPITEVITSNEFFDYNAKYEGEVLEVTPAQISEDLTNYIQKLTSKIYNLVDAKGIIRVDYIIREDNIPYLLEVNTTPGMTSTSFIPQQVAAAGLSMTDVLTEIIENEYQKLYSKHG